MVTEIKSSQKRKKILENLLFDKINGKPYYYKGYKEVLSKKSDAEEIRCVNGLQGFVISYLLEILYLRIKAEKYHFLASRAVIFINNENIISCDVFIFDKNRLKLSKIVTDYFIDSTPKIALEVDIRVDLSDEKDFGYVFTKTHKLLDFGVEKVFWIFTKHQKVMIAVKDQDWFTKDWNQEIELVDNEFFNIGQFLADEGVKP